MSAQVTDTVLMIRPVRFGFNEQTASNNAFQQRSESDLGGEIQQSALAEFDRFAEKLSDVGVHVIVFDDTLDPETPDSIFPNNWFSTHADGNVFLYPMFARNRRAERRTEIFQHLTEGHGYRIGLLVDLALNERRRIDGETGEARLDDLGEPSIRCLEGTGSMVLDREARIIYACLSPRTDAILLEEYARTFGYESCCFCALDAVGEPVYHTNVVMCIGSELAVICLDAIPELAQRQDLTHRLEQSGKQVLPITTEQMRCFAGNMLELRGAHRQHYMVMSQQALGALSAHQIATIESRLPIVSSPLDTIERYGGGSARCMLAEVFLPKC